MKRDEFINLFQEYRISERVKRYTEDKTFEVEFLRFDLGSFTHGTKIYITPEFTYIPRSLMAKMKDKNYKKMLDKIFMDFRSEYTMKGTMTYPFNIYHYITQLQRESYELEKENSLRYKFIILSTKVDHYMRGFYMGDYKTGTRILRYRPLRTESFVLKKALANGYKLDFQSKLIKSSEKLDEFCNECSSQLERIRRFYSEVFVTSRGMKAQETASLQTDFKTILTETMKTSLTYEKFKFWCRSRHDIFGQVVLREMELENFATLDVNVEERFNYMGPDHYKTPDYILDMGTYLLIVDFAVTTSNAGDIRDKKLDKYEEMAIGLSKHLKKEVRVDAAVWKINHLDEIQLPSEMSHIREKLIDSHEMKFLYQLHSEIAMMDRYDTFRVMSDEEDEENNEDFEFRLSLYKEMNALRLEDKNNFINMKAASIDEYRTKKRGSKKTMVKVRDTEFYKDLELTSEINHDMYLSSLKSILTFRMENGKVPPHMEDVINPDKKNLSIMSDKLIKKEMEKRKSFLSNTNFSNPKIFKFPALTMKTDMFPECWNDYTPDVWGFDFETTDGTYYYSNTFDWKEQKDKEDRKKTLGYNMDGIGTDVEGDSIVFEDIVQVLTEEMEDYYTTFLQDSVLDEALKNFMTTKMWALMDFVADLYMNLCYLEGRRHIFNDSKGHTVFKNFKPYFLMVKKGSKLTSQKQIRYKIFFPKDMILTNNDKFFHSFKESDLGNNFLETKWLTASITDIRHFCKIREVAMAMASNYYDKEREINRNVVKNYTLKKKNFMSYMMILLEHRRGTSTTLQLNRYLMHSATSFISNRKKLLNDIFSSPTRSYIESYCKISQMNWYMQMTDKYEYHSLHRVANMNSVSNEYDRFPLPSFFDMEEEIEFSMMMDEIYLGNLFDKEAGFTSHRVKQIVDKMESEELHFHKVKEHPWSKGDVKDVEEFFDHKDELHMFDKNFVVAATKRYFKKNSSKVKMQEALMSALSSTIDSAMMMTSSLVSGPFESEMLEFSKQLKKTKSFMSLYDEVKRLSSNLLVEMCNKMDTVDAIFAIFPKAQIGGPREILIQAVLLRIMVKFLETVSKEFCKTHPKEMLTKDRKKHEIQSDKMAEMREMLRILLKKGESSIYYSVNSDASRWSPGFVMDHFMHFVFNWDIPQSLKETLLAVVMSFCSKTMMVPDELRHKWEKKDSSSTEFLEGVQSFREIAVENGYTVEIMSGMGQGMFHYLSSFYHCVMDDMVEEVSKDVLQNVNRTILRETSLISSDDKTKLCMMVFKEGNVQSDRTLKMYIVLMDCLNRMANIHINWKKSGLNFSITEFNSLFSVGKRMTWATIKDLYTANSIPDLTAPEEAVVMMSSNIRRCMEHGVYLTTIQVLMEMARQQLIKYYRITKEDMDYLCEMFNCSYLRLPYQLGFFPITMPVETLIYGPEVHMFDEYNSEELKVFYNNLYTANKYRVSDKMKKTVPFSEDSKGKFWFELPSKLDKRLIELKKEFFDEKMGVTHEDIIMDMDKTSLNHNLYNTDIKKHEKFVKEFFVGMNRKYEFQETMVVHSLVRALQMSRKKGILYPKTAEHIMYEEELKSLRAMSEVDKKAMGSDYINEMERAKVGLESTNMDILDFALTILRMEESSSSSLSLYSGLQTIARNHIWVIDQLNSMVKVKKFLHPTMKSIRYYTHRIGTNVKSDDLIDHIFDVSHNSSNSSTMVLEDLLSMVGYDRNGYNRIYDNPFKFIEVLMNNSDKPFKDFKDFLDLNRKSMKFVKITMITSFYDSGNMEENVLNMYRTMGTPNYYWDYSNNMMLKEASSLQFLTAVSLKKEVSKTISYEESCYISLKDNSLAKAMKLRQHSNNEWISSSIMDCTRFEYKVRDERGVKIHTWTNLNMLIIAEEKNTKNVDIYAYSNNMIKETDTCMYLMSMVRRFEIEKVNEGYEVRYMNTGNKDETYGIMFNMTRMDFMTTIIYKGTKWQMLLKVRAKTHSRFKGESYREVSFVIFSDSYTVDSDTFKEFEVDDGMGDMVPVKTLMEEPVCLEQLDRIIQINAWLEPIDLEQASDTTESDKQKYSIQAMMEAFGNVNLENTISKIMTSKKAMDIMKESSSDTDTKSNKVMPFSIETVTTLASAIQESMNKSTDEDYEDSSEFTRASVTRTLDYMLTEAISMELSVNREVMKLRYNTYRANLRTKAFHNLLLWEINDSLDYKVSDTMLIMIYSVIIKNKMPFMEIEPISTLKKFDRSMRDKRLTMERMVKSKYLNDEEDEDMAMFE